MICLYQQQPNQMSFNHHVRTFGTTKNIIHVIEVPFLFIYVGTILLESVLAWEQSLGLKGKKHGRIPLIITNSFQGTKKSEHWKLRWQSHDTVKTQGTSNLLDRLVHPRYWNNSPFPLKLSEISFSQVFGLSPSITSNKRVKNCSIN